MTNQQSGKKEKVTVAIAFKYKGAGITVLDFTDEKNGYVALSRLESIMFQNLVIMLSAYYAHFYAF